MAESLFTSQIPTSPNAFDGAAYTLGTVIVPAVAGQVTHGRWLFPGTLPTGAVAFVLYDATTQAQLARATFSAPSTGNWNTVALTSPVSVSAGQRLVAAVFTPDRYVHSAGFFTSAGLTNGNLSAPATGSDPIGNGRFISPNDACPTSTFSGNSYFADVVFEASVGGASVAPAGVAVPAALGAPAVAWSSGVAPDGISAPAALGSPILGAAGVSPDGIGVAVDLGSPALVWSGAVAPDGISAPVVPGSPGVGAAGLAPDGVAVPVLLGAPAAVWAAQSGPEGLLIPVAVGAPAVRIPGQGVRRPTTVPVSRPTGGPVIRPAAVAVARPSL